MEEPFKVGDKVSCFGAYTFDTPYSVSVVARVDKHKLTLEDGTKWRLNGYGTWGDGHTGFSRPKLRPWKPAHDEAIKRARLLGGIVTFRDWSQMSTNRLDAVATVIRNYVAEAQGGDYVAPA